VGKVDILREMPKIELGGYIPQPADAGKLILHSIKQALVGCPEIRT
jgi:hypothetical protein